MTDNGDAMDTCQTPRPGPPMAEDGNEIKGIDSDEIKGLDDDDAGGAKPAAIDTTGTAQPIETPDMITLRSIDGFDFSVAKQTATRFECIKAAIGGDPDATVVPFFHPSATKVNVELGLELLAAVGHVTRRIR